jgi:hypothetical protein
MSVTVSPEALRIIGHDLELRGIKTFLIRCEAGLYIVEAGYQSPPAPTPITLHYTLDDIEQLEREARERNDQVSALKDFLSLSRIFWTVGTYVIAKGGHLLSVSNNLSTEKMPVVSIEYETVDDERLVDDLTGSDIYELCVSLYKLRGTSPIKNIRYTRFSALQESN